jgi:hypothetical protein
MCTDCDREFVEDEVVKLGPDYLCLACAMDRLSEDIGSDPQETKKLLKKLNKIVRRRF